MAKDSVSVSINNDMILWENEGKSITNFPINNIKVIGEYTTSEGPFIDDWFFVFILSADEIKEISAFAEGIHEVLIYLGKIKDAEIYGQLASSTQWKTRVIWPRIIEGQELYERNEFSPQNMWEKIKNKLGPKKFYEIRLTNEL